jgi:hypothetical protein
MTQTFIHKCPYCLTNNKLSDYSKLSVAKCGYCKNPLILNREDLRFSILKELYDHKYKYKGSWIDVYVKSKEVKLAYEYLIEKKLIRLSSSSYPKTNSYISRLLEYNVEITAVGIDQVEKTTATKYKQLSIIALFQQEIKQARDQWWDNFNQDSAQKLKEKAKKEQEWKEKKRKQEIEEQERLRRIKEKKRERTIVWVGSVIIAVSITIAKILWR